MSPDLLLSVEQMYKADKLTISAGMPGIELMMNAGRAVAHEIMKRWQPRETIILCGPGNNGGDGFVVASALSDAGWPVRVNLLGNINELTGDAALAAAQWNGRCGALSDASLDDNPLVVDALFGAGLSRKLGGDVLRLVQIINENNLDCVAVDIPSGVQGDGGEILNDAPRCRLTVTFFKAKPAHFLLPACEYMGDLVIADIGINDSVLDDIQPILCVNKPELWFDHFPAPKINSHKFSRGHLLIAGGNEMTGAALLVARAARRIGAGLVTIATPSNAWFVYASDQPGNLIKKVDTQAEFTELLAHPRINALVIGPGFGLGPEARQRVLIALQSKKPIVLDADGISTFADDPGELIDQLHEFCVITPHEGEFARIFNLSGDKVSRARQAAKMTNACVLLKGPDTVIAEPSGRAIINRSGTPYLATAGSGDVLSGLIGGLIVQEMDCFDAACAAAWMHGAAAERFGPGLIAEDIPELIPDLTGTIIKMSSNSP